MLPEKRKQLIIGIIALLGIILVIILMYNLSQYIRNRENSQEVVVVDDAYSSEYLYYGFIEDENGNYQLIGLNSDFEEEMLGLRSFYMMNNLYYYHDHLMLYTDAINQINYNATDNTYTFYEADPFYSNNVEVLIAENYYVYYHDTTLEYCEIANCSRTEITADLVDDTILLSSNNVFYQTSQGFYAFDLATGTNTLVMLPYPIGESGLLAADDDYVVLLNGDDLYAYQIDNGTTSDISEIILEEETDFEFINIQDNYIIYQVVDEEGNYNLRKYSLRIRDLLNTNFALESEQVSRNFVIDDTLLYAELVNGDAVRYVIMDMQEQSIANELDNAYLVMIGVS